MSYYFHTDPHDPTFFSKGTDPNNVGKYVITVKGPDSYTEDDRTYCEITIQPSGGTEVTIASGATQAPFKKNSVSKNNLSAGTYVFRAKADYQNSDHVEGPNGLSVTVP